MVLLTVVLSLGSAITYGVSDFFSAVGARRLRVLLGTTLTYLFALLALLALLPIIGGRWSQETVFWGMIAGIAAVFGFLFFYAALAAGPISLAAPLIAVISSLVPVVFAVLIGERLPVLAWVAVGMALLGAALISVSRGDGNGGISRKTVLLATLAGALLGLSVVSLDRAPQDSGITAAVVEIAIGVVLLGMLFVGRAVSSWMRRILGILDEQHDEATLPTVARARLSSAGGGVLLGLANALILLALQSGSLAVVSVLIGLYPVSTMILARLVYRERLQRVQLLGAALALAAAVLLAFSDTGSAGLALPQ